MPAHLKSASKAPQMTAAHGGTNRYRGLVSVPIAQTEPQGDGGESISEPPYLPGGVELSRLHDTDKADA